MNIPKIADSPEPNREDWIARRMDTELSQPLGAQSDILDSYDPILDPSYRLVKNWSVNYDEGLRNLGIAPLTGDAWIVMNSMKSKPAFVSFWSLIPHRDPSLQLWLGTNFRLVTVRLVGSANENLKFPLEKELTVQLLVKQQITAPSLVKAAKNTVRMLTGTRQKLTCQRPTHVDGSIVEDRIFPAKISFRDVKTCHLKMELGLKQEVKASFDPLLPHLPKLQLELAAKVAEPFQRAWEKLALNARQCDTRMWHKGRLATMLSDDYWSYAVAKVAAEISPQKINTLLYPAPITQWWFQRLVMWALMDLMAIPEPNWKERASKSSDRIEFIYSEWIKRKRSLSDSERKRAVAIRVRLGIPPFSAGQPEEAALTLSKLTYWIGRLIPRMDIFHDRANLGLDAANHPFWAEKLKVDLQMLWPHRNAVAPTGKNGRVKINRNFPSFAREDAAEFFDENYIVVEEYPGKRTGLNAILKEILDEKSSEKDISTDEILTWLQNIDRHREAMCLPQLASTNWMLTPALDIPAETFGDRWLKKMTFEKVTADSMLQKHPWFGLLENVALPETESDLAWRIPDSYWDSGVPEIEESATKKFKYMANKTAKCVTLALYFAQHAKSQLNEPGVLELVEFASLLSAERPFQQLKVMAYAEAGNLSLTTGEYFMNPTARWKYISKMTQTYNILALNGVEQVETLVIWAHLCPSREGFFPIFELESTDMKRLKPKNTHSEEEIGFLSLIKRKMAELNFKKGSAWQFTLRKLKWAARKMNLHVAILATSVEAESEVIRLVTSPNSGDSRALHE